ncbi:MAG: VOC family protein [Holophagae bacterium]|jgi:predicted enzyme related to lactoylglutathione lyase
MTPTAHGRFIWYDLNTTDPTAAKSFYNRLVGWGTQPFEGGGTPYTMWTVGSNPIGGVMELPDEAKRAGAPPHWVAYVAVDDVSAISARTVELGGAVLHPATDLEGAGSFAVLQDPQGVPFAVYTSDSVSPEPPEQAGAGHFTWHELASTDHEAGFEFYAGLFGWEIKEDVDMGDGAVYRIFGRPDSFPLGGMYTTTADMPSPPMWLYYISVPNVEDVAPLVAELGGTVLQGPVEIPGGDTIVQCMDPQGAAFALHSKASDD